MQVLVKLKKYIFCARGHNYEQGRIIQTVCSSRTSPCSYMTQKQSRKLPYFLVKIWQLMAEEMATEMIATSGRGILWVRSVYYDNIIATLTLMQY